ncbi:thiamine pyrophosphate-dependent enzyme, partial [Streptomyces europaeiscabiei]
MAAIVDSLPTNGVDRSEYLAELAQLKQDWEEKLAGRRDSDRFPFTSQRPLGALRDVLPRDAIIVAGSGNTQGAVKQTFPVYSPRTHLPSGGFSSMGWAIPAAVGAKLARPDSPVVCVLGDGDFLTTSQEIALSVTADAPVIFVVQNNAGYMSIRGGQRKQTSRHIGTEFSHPDGSPREAWISAESLVSAPSAPPDRAELGPVQIRGGEALRHRAQDAGHGLGGWGGATLHRTGSA